MLRRVEFRAGYDCERFRCRWGDPRCVPGEGHGIGGLAIRFALIGPPGAVTFIVQTGCPPLRSSRPEDIDGWQAHHLYPDELCYHSKTPLWKGQEPTTGSCPLTGGRCYCDFAPSGWENLAMYSLVNGGEEGLWTFLEEYYRFVYEAGPAPKPVEYPKPLRGMG